MWVLFLCCLQQFLSSQCFRRLRGVELITHVLVRRRLGLLAFLLGFYILTAGLTLCLHRLRGLILLADCLLAGHSSIVLDHGLHNKI